MVTEWELEPPTPGLVQQQKILLSKDKRNIEPSEAFIRDMREWIETQRTETTEIILFLDANEKWNKNSKIRRLAETINLHNLNIEGNYCFNVAINVQFLHGHEINIIVS